jgi:hypothetical protein
MCIYHSLDQNLCLFRACTTLLLREALGNKIPAIYATIPFYSGIKPGVDAKHAAGRLLFSLGTKQLVQRWELPGQEKIIIFSTCT